MNNEGKFWFKAKKWGWEPSSWQGWVITAVYLIGLLHFVFQAAGEHSAPDFLLNFGFNFIVLSIPFLIICYLKGERPEWPWKKSGQQNTQARP